LSNIIQSIKRIAPPNLWQKASQLRYAMVRAGQYPLATFHPWRRDSIHRLGNFRNTHQGERCFIIGNGPSLKNTDLSLLRNEVTFGLNRVYLLFPELGFSTTYFVSVNTLVIEQCISDLLTFDMPKFFSWRSRHTIDKETWQSIGDNKPIFLHTTYTGPKFASDVRGRVWEGATVTYVALQLAYYMGFTQVFLIGVDHSFTSQGKPNTTVISQGDDQDHFHAGYFGKGFRWQLPDLETSEKAYRMADLSFRNAGRQVYDATVDGKLNVFPKVDYSSLF